MLDRISLCERIKFLGEKIENNTELVAIGGTSLTLHNIKSQTRDVDFIVECGDLFTIGRLYQDVYGETIHLAEPGTTFALYMPGGYMSTTTSFGSFGNINLYALSIIGTIITKAARLNDRDREDIQLCRRENIVGLVSRINEFSFNVTQFENVKTASIDILGIDAMEFQK